MQVRHVVGMVHKFGSTDKGRSLRDGTHDTIDGMLVMNVMQVGSMAFAILIHKENLVVRIEMDNAVLRVETRSKTHPDMIADHDRIANMQVSHGCERQFRAASASHADVQSGKGPSTLQCFEADVTCIST